MHEFLLHNKHNNHITHQSNAQPTNTLWRVCAYGESAPTSTHPPTQQHVPRHVPTLLMDSLFKRFACMVSDTQSMALQGSEFGGIDNAEHQKHPPAGWAAAWAPQIAQDVHMKGSNEVCRGWVHQRASFSISFHVPKVAHSSPYNPPNQHRNPYNQHYP